MEYLAHHGVKGQKWGVRRYQNKDGTLTSTGRSRHSSPSAQKKRIASLQSAGIHFLKAHTNQINQINMQQVNDHINQIHIQMAIDRSIRDSINAANMASSLSLTNGTNPYVFGMM